MDSKIKLEEMEQTCKKQFLLELLAAAITMAIVLFATVYSSVVRVANGGSWWTNPLMLVIGIVIGTAARYAFRAWMNKTQNDGR